MFPVLYLFTMMGAACCFNLAYSSFQKIFEVKRAARVLGTSAFLARALSGLAPILSNLEQPMPVVITCVITIIICVLKAFIKEPRQVSQPVAKAVKSANVLNL